MALTQTPLPTQKPLPDLAQLARTVERLEARLNGYDQIVAQLKAEQKTNQELRERSTHSGKNSQTLECHLVRPARPPLRVHKAPLLGNKERLCRCNRLPHNPNKPHGPRSQTDTVHLPIPQHWRDVSKPSYDCFPLHQVNKAMSTSMSPELDAFSAQKPDEC